MTLPSTRPLIYLISEGCLTDTNYEQKSKYVLAIIESAVQAGIPLIQLREKHITGRRLFELAQRGVSITRRSATRLLMNDRLDIALTAKTDGVHLTSRSVQPEVVRQFVPKGFLIGMSVHSVEEIEPARNGGADLVIYGPVFQTPGKPVTVGLAGLKEAVVAVPGFPVLGVGGIDASNYKKVLETGAAGFAAIRFLNNASNLEKLNSEFSL